MRAVVLVAIVVACLTVGCSSAADPSPDPVSKVPGLDAPTASQTPQVTPHPKVRVGLVLKVEPSSVTAAFSAFLKSRTQSFLAGRPLASLAQLATRRELTRQRGLISSALDRGLTVPAKPRAAVLDMRRSGQRRAVLDVCFYLPATEYVDEATGSSPYGPIPHQWQPAVVSLTRSSVTWKVDKLLPPKPGSFECKGL